MLAGGGCNVGREKKAGMGGRVFSLASRTLPHLTLFHGHTLPRKMGPEFSLGVKACPSGGGRRAETEAVVEGGLTSKFGIREPLPVQVVQPIPQPCENQKALCRPHGRASAM